MNLNQLLFRDCESVDLFGYVRIHDDGDGWKNKNSPLIESMNDGNYWKIEDQAQKWFRYLMMLVIELYFLSVWFLICAFEP